MMYLGCFCLPFAAAGLFWLATRRPVMRGRDIGGHRTLPPIKGIPALSELGVTKNESARAQKLAALSEEKFKEITDADLARRKGMGEKAIQYARSYALQAERKLGEMLRKTEKAKGTAGKGRPKLGGTLMVPPKKGVPALPELGVTKKESARAQKAEAVK
jgi:hypothetical protein